MSKRQEVIDKKRDRLKYLEDRALPKADHYQKDAEKRLEDAKRDLRTWSASRDEITEEIEDLELEIQLLEEGPFDDKPQPTVGSWSDHTGMSAWEATSGYEL